MFCRRESLKKVRVGVERKEERKEAEAGVLLLRRGKFTMGVGVGVRISFRCPPSGFVWPPVTPGKILSAQQWC
jgi:hypothetical protein